MAVSEQHTTTIDHLAQPPLTRMLRALQRRWALAGGLGVKQSEPSIPSVLASSARILSEKRRHHRVAVSDIAVQVTDGCLFATARIDDISPGGIRLSSLPEQLFSNVRILTVFSSNNPGMPVLQVEPHWQRTSTNGKSIGASILNPTEAWRLFFAHTGCRTAV